MVSPFQANGTVKESLTVHQANRQARGQESGFPKCMLEKHCNINTLQRFVINPVIKKSNKIKDLQAFS